MIFVMINYSESSFYFGLLGIQKYVFINEPCRATDSTRSSWSTDSQTLSQTNESVFQSGPGSQLVPTLIPACSLSSLYCAVCITKGRLSFSTSLIFSVSAIRTASGNNGDPPGQIIVFSFRPPSSGWYVPEKNEDLSCLPGSRNFPKIM